MPRIAGLLLACALALANTPANAQAGATPAPTEDTAGEPGGGSAQVPTADDICRALEQSAAENALPVEFFARVIWQESRFDAKAISPKGAAGIAQFMPRTASWHGLADPFEPIQALRHSAAYLRELLDQFGNLGLAAAAYNAGPGRVAGGHSLVVPVRLPCGGRRRRLSLGTGPLGVLTACWVRAELQLSSCCQARKLRTVFPCVPLSRSIEFGKFPP